MESKRLRARAGGLGRRDFNRLLGGLGLGAAALALPGRRALARPNLTVFEWAGYDIPELIPEFVEKHGEPTWSIFAEEEEAYQKLRAGFRVDLSHPCTISVARWRDAGLIKPIDTSRIPRWNVIPQAMLEIPGVVYEGQYWMMPWDWGNSTIVYRHDLIESPVNSYRLLLDPALRGRISVFDSADEAFAIAAGILGIENHLEMSDDQLTDCAEVLRQIHPNVRYYWTDNTSVEQSLASGEIHAAWVWTSSYVALKAEGMPVTFMIPDEGLSTWMCGFSINAEGPGDEDLVYDYLNAVLAPEVGQFLIDEYGYGHVNGEAYALSESDIIEELGLDQGIQEFLAGTIFQGEIAPPLRDKMIEIWETVKLGG